MNVAIDFDAIRASHPLESIVQASVQLRRSGGNKVGCCPFHNDRSPSFVVYGDGHYHCYGCGAHGDVIDFVAAVEKVSVVEAIRSLTGGSTPTFTAEDRERRDAERRASEDRQRRREAEAMEAARNRWARALEINGAGTGYLIRKNVAPYGCRREGENLLVPIFGPDGLILSVQAIPPEAGGRKLFHAGVRMAGGRYVIGNDPGDIDQPIVVVEGFATGATVQAATGFAVAVAFSKANLATVACDLAAREPGRALLIGADTNGVEEASEAASRSGARVVVPEILGADGTDFNDQAGHYGLDDVAALFRAALAPPAVAPLALLVPADWHGVRAPDRAWWLDGLIPEGQATLCTGAGAVGKSLATQQLATSTAMGAPFLGIATSRAPTLYITCEDDTDELHRRQTAICEALRIPLSDTRGHLFLLSLQGELANELATFDAAGAMAVAKRYVEIVDSCRVHGIRRVVLDNTAHLFAGNENDRHQVAGFVGLCNRMAREIGGAVLVVGHPNKAGDSYSGSTAWENQVRSRLFIETPKGDDGVPFDPDLRVMRNEKANYARRNSEVRFMWVRGAFVLESEIPQEQRDEMAANMAAARGNEIFLRCLDESTANKVSTSASQAASNYAPRVFVKMPTASGLSVDALEQALHRLLHLGEIANEQRLFQRENRSWVTGLGRTE